MALRNSIGMSLFLACFVLAAASVADHAPVILPDGTLVHGDWGLYRPGHMPLVYEGPHTITAPRAGSGKYFPTNRDDPSAYRSRAQEIQPSMPGEPYFRSWGAQSDSQNPPNATIYPPFEPPSVIYEPRFDRPGHKGKQTK